LPTAPRKEMIKAGLPKKDALKLTRGGKRSKKKKRGDGHLRVIGRKSKRWGDFGGG